MVREVMTELLQQPLLETKKIFGSGHATKFIGSLASMPQENSRPYEGRTVGLKKSR